MPFFRPAPGLSYSSSACLSDENTFPCSSHLLLWPPFATRSAIGSRALRDDLVGHVNDGEHDALVFDRFIATFARDAH